MSCIKITAQNRVSGVDNVMIGRVLRYAKSVMTHRVVERLPAKIVLLKKLYVKNISDYNISKRKFTVFKIPYFRKSVCERNYHAIVPQRR